MNFKKLFLSSALFFTTCGYSIAQSHNSMDVVQSSDTIWDYAYPVLERPVIVLDDDGQITTFSCSGLYYTRLSNQNFRNLGFYETEALTVSHETESLWRIGLDDLRSRLGIKSEKTLMKLVIKTIAYHYINENYKSSAKKLSSDKIPVRENSYIKNFNKEIRSINLRLNRRGRPYDYAAYLRRQQSSGNSR